MGDRINTLLFDLDGTLTDPREGIVGSIAYALERLGRPVPPLSALERYIGPPLYQAFEELLETDDRARIEGAIELYRERFRDEGIFENRVYPGIADALTTLQASGFTLVVASSKPHPFVRRIIEHFGLRAYFTNLYGSELSGVRSDKVELIAHVLECEGLGAEDGLMIGDRLHDARGAIENQVRSVGVSWGYGSRAELTQAGCERIVDSPEQLVDYLTNFGVSSVSDVDSGAAGC